MTKLQSQYCTVCTESVHCKRCRTLMMPSQSSTVFGLKKNLLSSNPLCFMNFRVASFRLENSFDQSLTLMHFLLNTCRRGVHLHMYQNMYKNLAELKKITYIWCGLDNLSDQYHHLVMETVQGSCTACQKSSFLYKKHSFETLIYQSFTNWPSFEMFSITYYK